MQASALPEDVKGQRAGRWGEQGEVALAPLRDAREGLASEVAMRVQHRQPLSCFEVLGNEAPHERRLPDTCLSEDIEMPESVGLEHAKAQPPPAGVRLAEDSDPLIGHEVASEMVMQRSWTC